MAAKHPPRRRGELTGRGFLAIALGFFGVIIAVNTGLAVVAGGTFPGIVVENSYTASQNYNDVLAAARAQADAGWKGTLSDDEQTIVFSLLDRSGAARPALTVNARAER